MIKRNIDTILLLILWIITLNSFYKVIFSGGILGVQNYIAYVLLIVLTVVKLRGYKRFRTFLGIFLLLGAFNLIHISLVHTVFSLGGNLGGFTFTTFGFNPTMTLILAVFIFAHRAHIKKVTLSLLSGDAEERKSSLERRMDSYYQELSTATDEKVADIISKSDYFSSEYVSVARKVWKERGN